MKIAVVGCGALGSYYGGKLLQSGHEVHFLLRSDYPAVQQNGLLVRSPLGDFRVRPNCWRAPEEIGRADLVLIGLKTTANDQFERLLPPLAGFGTLFLTLQNGLGNEARLAELFGPEAVLGGNCFVCLNRIAPGVIQHIAYGQVVLGEYQRLPLPRTHEIAGLFEKAGLACSVTPNLEQARWEKLIWNIPFNGLGVASAAGFQSVLTGRLDRAHSLGACLDTAQLLADPGWESLVRELMTEIIACARRRGFSTDATLAEKLIRRTRQMGCYKPSTVIDFERGRPLEIEALFLEPLRQARQSGLSTPRLETLCRLLESLNVSET